jgi:hypothetical protein
VTAPLLEWVERKSLSLRLPMKGSMPPSGPTVGTSKVLSLRIGNVEHSHPVV